MKIEEIKKEKQYSLYELLRSNAFPWIKSYNSYLKLALTEKENLGLLIFGEGKGTNYRIKGENLIKFLSLKAKTYEQRKQVVDQRANAKKEVVKKERVSQTIKQIESFDKVRAKKRPKANVGGGLKIARKIRKQRSTEI
jgi:hypothetical protein